MTRDELLVRLRDPSDLGPSAFAVLKGIGCILAEGKDDSARELLLRALDRRQELETCAPILAALTRAVGLFPYADPELLSTRDRVAYEYHKPLEMDETLVFHREQVEVYLRLMEGENVILSAPTSFGKSRIIDALLASGRYANIAIIVPTLALIDETRRRLGTAFGSSFKVVSHLSQTRGDRSIFVFTAERAVSYTFPPLDLVVIDEFYKIGAAEDDQSRTVALNQAFYNLRKVSRQFYLLGPNIERIPEGMEQAFKCYFHATRFTTVVAEHTRVPAGDSEEDRLIALTRTLAEPTLIFCRSPARANDVASLLLANSVGAEAPALAEAAKWIGDHFHRDWIVGKALPHGIGVHHGKLPRSIAQFIVRAFNDGHLRFLVCTSTLIEGVNTRAKNIIILDNKINKSPIDYFTFNNIRGRVGRMFRHFVGHVYLFHEPPTAELPFVDFPLFTQSASAPDSLLVQIEEADLKEDARKRIDHLLRQGDVPIWIFRQNSGLDPTDQLALARTIAASSSGEKALLAWSGSPSATQLEHACVLIWDHFVKGRRSGGVFSAKQLKFKLNDLMYNHSVAVRAEKELTNTNPQFRAKSADEAVERVLDFDRTWAGFEFPRYLMALSRIQAHVLGKLGLPIGDYTVFATRVESLFQNPVAVALEEYGIPIQVGSKLERHFGTGSDLDTALSKLRGLNVAVLGLNGFELEVVEDARKSL